MYTVLEKSLASEKVRVAKVFETFTEAETWMESQMSIWEDEKSYKIVGDQ